MLSESESFIAILVSQKGRDFSFTSIGTFTAKKQIKTQKREK